ncbi:MAG: nucleotidyltransferase domain-containing protein, partial [Armatimonadetes bacterium]|nr:nucleotidyltransferase domain-containing protein [Armatimonadota bacterium]MDW8121407.1 nucleotidyltransferase domain-containing protein [Armatimonadota bacterium]
MPSESSDSLKALSGHPDYPALLQFLEKVHDRYGERLEFVVLFGSAATGNWTINSDLDILIGLRGEDGLRFLDRIDIFGGLAKGNIEIFPYAQPEWEQMF